LPRAPNTQLSKAQAILGLVGAIVIYILSNLEDKKSVRPSSILNVYLFMSSLFDAVQIRTLWLLEEGSKHASILTAILVVKVLILAFEAQNKTNRLIEPYRKLGPEATSGVFSRSFFWWLNPFLYHGFRSLLFPNDLFKIDIDLSSMVLEKKFQSSWNSSQQENKYGALCTFIRALKGPIAAAAIPRLCQTGFTFCQPFLISRVIDFVSSPVDEPKNFDYGLIGATFVIYTGLAFSTALYKHKIYRIITMARGGLVSLIYNKTLLLESGALKDSAAITLMSTDIESIATGLTDVHEIWASPIDIVIAVYLLQREIGLASITPVLIACLFTFGSVQIAKISRRRQSSWVKAVQDRVGLTSSLLIDIKGLRMCGLLEGLAYRVQELRRVEVQKAKSCLRVDTLMNLCANSPTLISPSITLLTFAFVHVGTTSTLLTSSRAFYSISIVSLMTSPLSLALNTISTFFASLACFERIQKYWLLEERSDYRLLKSEISSSTAPNESIISQQNDVEMKVLESPDKDPPMFSIVDGSFGYSTEDQAILSDINIECRRGVFTILLGPMGSGKSTLLKALLGETKCFKGFVSLSTSSISYCGQDSWISNSSLRDNILSGLEYDETLYQKVINACGLVADITQLPQGDMTKLGN